MSLWRPGQPFKPKQGLSLVLRNCGITESGWGNVTHVTPDRISFYLQRTADAGGVEASCEPGMFAANFIADPWRPMSLGYISTRHFPKTFPHDLM